MRDNPLFPCAVAHTKGISAGGKKRNELLGRFCYKSFRFKKKKERKKKEKKVNISVNEAKRFVH